MIIFVDFVSWGITSQNPGSWSYLKQLNALVLFWFFLFVSLFITYLFKPEVFRFRVGNEVITTRYRCCFLRLQGRLEVNKWVQIIIVKVIEHCTCRRTYVVDVCLLDAHFFLTVLWGWCHCTEVEAAEQRAPMN